MTGHRRTLLRITSTLALGLAVTAPTSARGYVLKAPWRGDSLPAGVYMRTSGHIGFKCPGVQCGMDLGAVRFDEGAQKWSLLKHSAELPVGSGPDATPHHEFLGWEMPFYAPVDGEVIGCWRSMPEEEADGAEPMACAGLAGGACAAGGNHLWIRTDDHHVVFLGHLRQDSIPEHLCPIAASAPLPPLPGSQVPCSRGDDWVRIRADVRLDHYGLPPADMVTGERIGSMGSSGGSDGPHLHLGVYEYWEDPGSGEICYKDVPYEFTESWSQVRNDRAGADPDGWDRLAGEALEFDGSFYLLWPDPVAPRVDHQALAGPHGIGDAPAVVMIEDGVIAAHRHGRNLVVRSHRLDDDARLESADIAIDLDVHRLDLARVAAGERHVVAVVQDVAAQLALVPYHVSPAGALTRGTPRTESAAGVGVVAATRSPRNDGVVAAIQHESSLVVIPYTVALDGTTLSLDRGAEASSDAPVGDLDVVTLDGGPFVGVATAERGADGTAWLRTWAIDDGGVRLVDSAQLLAGGVGPALVMREVDVAVAGVSPQSVVVTGADASGLVLQTWRVAAAGDLQVLHQYDAAMPGWGSPQLSSTRVGERGLVVGLVDPDLGHALLSFAVAASGEIRRVGTVDGNYAAALAVAGDPTSDRAVAFVRDISGFLYLSSYATNYASD